MSHVTLTCRHHPDLRWSCKEVAWTRRPDGTGYYNQSRNIFFLGVETARPDGTPGGFTEIDEDGTLIRECKCPASDLILVVPTIPKETADDPQ